MSSKQTFVIVGAGLAGAKAAETLRTEGFDGDVVLLGDEPVRPYERPPLSKDYLRGEVDFNGPAVHDTDFYAAHDIELRTSTAVSAVDTDGRVVTPETGEPVHYDAMLLATGAQPRRLSIPGAELPGVHYLRTVADSDAIHSDIAASAQDSAPVVVIGAGWIGCEVAASARQLGAEVAVVEPGSAPLERVLGLEVGRVFAELHATHGVQLHLGVGVEAFTGSERVEEVRLANGTKLAAGMVVVGIGVGPRTSLAEAAGLTVDNGVITDEFLATSAPGVFAAGDVANVFHPRYGTRIRLEHWSAALNQGPVAARNMLGRATPYEKLPYFYSDQYDFGMEYRGFAPHFDQVVFRGDTSKYTFIAFWLNEGRVLAVMNANVWDQNDQIEALLDATAAVDASRLADRDVDLAEVASAATERL